MPGFGELIEENVAEAFERGFHDLVPRSVCLRRLWSDGGWTEGPTWLPAAGEVVFSDIPNDRQMAYSSVTGSTRQLRGGSGHFVNGTALDARGRLLLCEHGSRALAVLDGSGSRRILVDSYRGGRLNSPNDVAVAPSGAVWFTDPSYGLEVPGQGVPGEREQTGNHVYRLDAAGGLDAVLTDFAYPNGIAFSPEGAVLYVADSGGSRSPNDERHIRRFDVDEAGKPTGGGVFATCPNGVFDGFAVDARGNVWASARDGVYVIARSGTVLGRIAVPECVSNLCFGGEDGADLYVTASSSLYSVTLRGGSPRSLPVVDSSIAGDMSMDPPSGVRAGS